MFYFVRILYCLSPCIYVLSGTKELYKRKRWNKGKLHEEKSCTKMKQKEELLKASDDRIASRTVRDTKSDVRTSSRTIRIMPPKISGITGQVGPSDLCPDRPSIKPDRPTYDDKHQ